MLCLWRGEFVWKRDWQLANLACKRRCGHWNMMFQVFRTRLLLLSGPVNILCWIPFESFPGSVPAQHPLWVAGDHQVPWRNRIQVSMSLHDEGLIEMPSWLLGAQKFVADTVSASCLVRKQCSRECYGNGSFALHSHGFADLQKQCSPNIWWPSSWAAVAVSHEQLLRGNLELSHSSFMAAFEFGRGWITTSSHNLNDYDSNWWLSFWTCGRGADFNNSGANLGTSIGLSGGQLYWQSLFESFVLWVCTP